MSVGGGPWEAESRAGQHALVEIINPVKVGISEMVEEGTRLRAFS
jgi:hypothetical protein